LRVRGEGKKQEVLTVAAFLERVTGEVRTRALVRRVVGHRGACRARRLHEGSLQRLIGVRALALTAMNTTVGAGIFGLPALIARRHGCQRAHRLHRHGAALLLRRALFRRGGSRVSTAGGLYAYSNAAFGPFTGSFVGTLLWFGNGALSNAAVAVLMVNGLSLAFPALGEPFGRKPHADRRLHQPRRRQRPRPQARLRVTEGITVIKLLPLILLAVVGLVTLKWSAIPLPELPDTGQLGRGVVLLTFTFMGIETALSPSAEIATRPGWCRGAWRSPCSG
jgi:amino acid transporter